MEFEETNESEAVADGSVEIEDRQAGEENVTYDEDDDGGDVTESFSSEVVDQEDNVSYNEEVIQTIPQDQRESSSTENEEPPVNEEFVPEESYQQEVISDEVVEEVADHDAEREEEYPSEDHMVQEELVSDQEEEEVADHDAEREEEYPSEDHMVQEELVSDQEEVETQQEEVSEEQDASGDGEYEEAQHEETIESESSLPVEAQKSADESDDDFDNVVEVEQKLESGAEDDNIAEHVSDSDNDGEEKTEEIKLGNVMDDDEAHGSSASEHEASDIEESSSPVKKRAAVLDSDDDEEPEIDKKKQEEAAMKMFDSESEDEGQEGVGELIADIFGESDDDGEEFTGFGAEEVSKKQKSGKTLAVSDDSDDDSIPPEADDSDDDEKSKKKSKKSKETVDSDSDEGVKDRGQQGMSDFDIMLAKKKAENRRSRKRRDNGTFITDADDIINAMLTKMKEAAEADREANLKRKPALAKMKMLPSVVKHLKKQNLKEIFVDNGVIAAIADWLSLLPDRSLPHITIRTELLKVLHDLPSVGPETLKHSGIGKAVMILFKHPKEARPNRDSAGRLINKWSRPIFGLNENFKSMSREEREQRDLEQMPQAKRKKLTGGDQARGDQRPDVEPGQLRPGEAGFVMRARVPMPSTKDYVVRPKWNVDSNDRNDDDDNDDDSERPVRVAKRRRSAGAPRSSKKDERLDKHIRNFAEKRKSTKLQRAVKISIEGNKMSIA